MEGAGRPELRKRSARAGVSTLRMKSVAGDLQAPVASAFSLLYMCPVRPTQLYFSAEGGWGGLGLGYLDPGAPPFSAHILLILQPVGLPSLPEATGGQWLQRRLLKFRNQPSILIPSPPLFPALFQASAEHRGRSEG